MRATCDRASIQAIDFFQLLLAQKLSCLSLLWKGCPLRGAWRGVALLLVRALWGGFPFFPSSLAQAPFLSGRPKKLFPATRHLSELLWLPPGRHPHEGTSSAKGHPRDKYNHQLPLGLLSIPPCFLWRWQGQTRSYDGEIPCHEWPERKCLWGNGCGEQALETEREVNRIWRKTRQGVQDAKQNWSANNANKGARHN